MKGLMYGFAATAVLLVGVVPFGAAHAWQTQQQQYWCGSYYSYSPCQQVAYQPQTYTNYSSDTTLYYNNQVNYATYTQPSYTPPVNHYTYTQPSYNNSNYSYNNYNYGSSYTGYPTPNSYNFFGGYTYIPPVPNSYNNNYGYGYDTYGYPTPHPNDY